MSIQSLQTFRDEVVAIKTMAGDPERAHSAEDALRADILRAIADDSGFPITLARIALSTDDIDFPRWCA